MGKIGIFPGTFDPPTLGHLDIIHKAKKICDHLIVAIAQRREKRSLFSPKEKIQMLKKIAPGVEILHHQGLIATLAKEKKAFLIRGLRTGSDFDLEFQMAQANKRIGGVETIFLLADDRYSHISSTLIREIAHFKGPLQGFVPKEIEALIIKKSRIDLL